MNSLAKVIDARSVTGTYQKENLQTHFGPRYPNGLSAPSNDPEDRLSVTVHDANRFDVLGDLVTSQPFMKELENISDGWICQDPEGKIAVCSTHANSSIETLTSQLIHWGKGTHFKQHLIVLIARQQNTSTRTYRRLRIINKLIGSYFGRKIRLCLVTKNDLLYIRPESNSKQTS